MTVSAILLCGCSKKEEPVKQVHRSISLRLVHGPEIQALIKSLKQDFLSRGPVLQDGQKVELELISSLGTVAAKGIASGSIKTDGWLASSRSLVNYTNMNLSNLGPQQVECKQLFATPVIIATQKRNRYFFNAVGDEFSWKEFFDARIDQTQAETKQPLNISFAHGSPLSSTSGLASLLQLTYLATFGEKRVLDSDLLRNKTTLSRLKHYEEQVSNYGVSESFFLDKVVNSSPDRVAFALTTEHQLALFNAAISEPSKRLIALYPKEGSYWEDYNLCMSDSDWTGPAARAALRMWTDYLSSDEAQFKIKQHGLRPSVVNIGEVAPLDQNHGVNTSLPSASYLPAPGDVTSFLLESWGKIQRPVAMQIVLDTSGSMEKNLLVGQDYLRNWLAASSQRDLKSLMSFSSEVRIDTEFTDDSVAVIKALDQTRALGGSSLYEGIKQALSRLSEKELAPYRKALLLFTDGEDLNSQISLEYLSDLVRQKSALYDIHLMIIAVKKEGASHSDLQRLAKAANGVFVQGDLLEMNTIFSEMFKNI
ncbi:MAG: substrate-binding domain-containing protein [Bdellovibrionales bacterium]|nr:substrate-binding domain-containing protein [Bdellovibrionales bacterium]